MVEIASCGHEIGLHFDEVRYPELNGDLNAIANKILEECRILGEAVGKEIKAVSMHRPSRAVLDADLQIPNSIINSYRKTFFNDFKYLSDSRRHWREPVDDIVASEQYNRLHILTHAFWYNNEELNLHDSICGFINGANQDRYDFLYRNITDLPSIMDRSEVV